MAGFPTLTQLQPIGRNRRCRSGRESVIRWGDEIDKNHRKSEQQSRAGAKRKPKCRPALAQREGEPNGCENRIRLKNTAEIGRTPGDIECLLLGDKKPGVALQLSRGLKDVSERQPEQYLD